MPRKGENIYKRKDGRWEGRYIRSYDSEHKAKYAYVYGKTYSEVKRKLTEQRGNVQKVQPTKNKSSTYGELLDCWLHSMQLNTKESTQARYTHLIKTHIKPHLGAVQLSQLTTDAIEIFIEQQLTDGRLDNSGGLSPKTVTDILTIIKSTIEYARYKELPVICNLSKLSIKKKEKEMRVFTPSEQESLIGTLTNDMDHSKFGVLLSLYILKESFERAYIKCGWDLENSIYIPNGHSKFPTFNDVLEALPEIINSSSYSSDSKGDYTGALVTRVKSLTNGISGQVLCSVNDIDEEYLFDQNTIVDLSRVSSLETKSLLMGVLILKLNEYRMCTSEENQPLRHVTVMEEAHNILKRSPTGGSEGSNVQAKSVEMISSAIAEMRTYGEGFIIVDQSPTAVDVSAVKNTNTKIIMRLPDYEDCKIAGLSMGLNDSQIREISRFPMGVAVVYQNNWVEAVLTQIDKSEEQYHQTDLITDDYALAVIKGQLAVELIFQYETGLAADEGFQLDDLLEVINNSDINASKKQDIVGG